MARPLVLAACLLLGLGRGAAAGGRDGRDARDPRTSKVTIETDPPGAKVYFNVKEDGEVCTTPCTIDAPIGETPIIIEAENRRSVIENLVVPRKSARPIRMQYKLKPALGTLVIEGGDGAAILLDDEHQGTAPRRFEDILAGAHHVVLEKNGKKLYDAFVEVEIGREATVTPPRLAAEPAPVTPNSEVPGIAARQSPSPTGSSSAPSFAVTATTDIGFRQFTFNYPAQATRSRQMNDREVGEVLSGGMIELWPMTLLRLGVLPGLALYGRFALGVNPQSVTLSRMDSAPVTTALETSWRNVELSARQRWVIADAGAVEVGAGYIVDRYQFTSNDPDPDTRRAERAIVPDAAYKSVRIGARASLLFGRFEPYLTAESRIVISGGVLESRYEQRGSAVGYLGALGAVVHLGHIEAQVGGSITLYSWTLHPSSNADDQADGASDVIEKITLSVGYVY